MRSRKPGTTGQCPRAAAFLDLPLDMSPSLRVFFTLAHTMSGPMVAAAFAPFRCHPGLLVESPVPGIYNAVPATREGTRTMCRAELARWVSRDPGFAEWPIKRPIGLTVALRSRATRSPGARPERRWHAPAGGAGLSVTGLHRAGELLLQDGVVELWDEVAGGEQADAGDRLCGAILQVRAVYDSFSERGVACAPRFHNLQLRFPGPESSVLFFTARQLATPRMAGTVTDEGGRTGQSAVVIDYRFTLTADLLSRQRLRADWGSRYAGNGRRAPERALATGISQPG